MRLFSKFFLFLSVFCSALLFSGCSDSAAAKQSVKSLRIISGAEQFSESGKEFAQPLRIQVLGPEEPGFFSSPKPLSSRKIRFTPCPGSKIKVIPETAVSDAVGCVSAKIKAEPDAVGDQFIDISSADDPAIRTRVRVIPGVSVSGNDAEYRTGAISSLPVRVRIQENGKPLAGIPVRFTMRATAEGSSTTARVLTPETVTNRDGFAETYVQLGKVTGIYRLGIAAGNPEKGVLFRDTTVKLLAISPLHVIITVLGGLAFFIFGMCMMSDGIRLVAGENMRKILAYFTSNRVFALLAGTLVTGILQSSAATTLMVIGFINAGLLTLAQSIGIIFGANIGTTITAQIISFNLSGIALPCITIGFFMTLVKKRVFGGWGTVTLGFGLLFLGMMMMSNELKVLGEMESFKQVFATFNCAPGENSCFMPIGAVLGALFIGIVGTVILQSSSAFTGVVLALAAGHLVDFYTAVPLLIGSNIGTTFTTMLGAINANRVAKQAALAHTLFNFFGAVVVIILLYIPVHGQPSFLYFVNSMTPGNAFAPVPQNLERHIAMAHTMFNVVIALLLLPFVKQFAQLCAWILPIREKLRTNMLEPALLNTPSVALRLTSKALYEMVEKAWDMVDKSVNEHFLTGDTSARKYEALAKAEEGIDQMQSDITAYLVKLSRRRLTGAQARQIPLLMHCTNDAERIADHTEIILQLNDRMVKQEKKLSDSARKDLHKLWEQVSSISETVADALSGKNQDENPDLRKEAGKLHRMASKFEAEHIDRLRRGSCTAACGVIYIELLGELVKIGDRLVNIAERAPEIRRHYVNLKYVKEKKNEKNHTL